MKRITLVLLALVIFFGGTAFADGFIKLERPPRMPVEQTLNPLAVKFHNVKVTITDQAAVTEVDQVFENPNNMVLEGTYIFPLPDDAAIENFTLFINGENTKGELLDADKARQIYESIVRSQKDPALLEYVGTRMFRCRVFPIPAKGERRITLKYSEMIKMDDGVAYYSYPLNTEKFSSKPLETVSIETKIQSKIPIKNVYSPTHKVEVVRKDDNNVTVAFEEKNVTPDRNFDIYYTVTEKEFGLNVLTYQTGKEDGYFMMMISPKYGSDKDAVAKKDIVFVLDKSGSMSGAKMDQAKKALQTCLRNLNENDRFGLIVFSTSVDPYEPNLLPATKENIKKACDFVENVEAIGGTNVDEALTTALGMNPGAEEKAGVPFIPFMIMFLTDGLPTIGERDPASILKDIKGKTAPNVRLFCLGVGDELNSQLLDKLANDNHGVSEYIGDKEDLEIKLSKFYAKIANPVLSDLMLKIGDIKTYDVFPRNLPDIFKGTQLTVFGRYHGDGKKIASILGHVNKEKQEFEYEINFAKEDDKNSFIPRLWAVRKIGYMLEEIRLNPGNDNKELKDSIVALSQKFGIMTPYTSFLVLEPGMKVPGDGRPRPVPLASAMPGAEDRMKKAEEAKEGFAAEKGAGGVRASRGLNKMKGDMMTQTDLDNSSIAKDEEGRSLIKHVGAKTFYFIDKVWFDAEVAKDAKKTQIKYMSDEYFELIKKNKGIGKYLALGELVVLKIGDTVYEITKK